MKQSVVARYPGKGWTNVDIDVIVKLQKSWDEEDGEACRVDVYFGRLLNRGQTPVVIMNVTSQGCGTKYVIDDNCDIWENLFASTSKEEGNEYYKYLKKHGFTKA